MFCRFETTGTRCSLKEELLSKKELMSKKELCPRRDCVQEGTVPKKELQSKAELQLQGVLCLFTGSCYRITDIDSFSAPSCVTSSCMWMPRFSSSAKISAG